MHVCVSSRGSPLSHGKVEKDKHAVSVAGVAHFDPLQSFKAKVRSFALLSFARVCMCVCASFIPVCSALRRLLCNNPTNTFHWTDVGTISVAADVACIILWGQGLCIFFNDISCKELSKLHLIPFDHLIEMKKMWCQIMTNAGGRQKAKAAKHRQFSLEQ